MSSLYKRATPSQQRILRAVEGAVKNATDAHPNLKIEPHHRRSIAKRAAGTLSAQWVGVLAARQRGPSDSGLVALVLPPDRREPDPGKATGRGSHRQLSRAPLRRLRNQLAYQMKRIKRDEPADYARAMIDVLKMIAEHLAESHLKAKTGNSV